MKLPLLLALSLSALALAVACSDPTPTLPTQPTATFVPTPSSISTATHPRSDTALADISELVPEPSATAIPAPEVLPSPTPRPFPTPAYNEDWAEASGLKNLQRENPDLGSRFESLSWVADGVSQEEREAVELVIRVAMQNEPVFLAVLDRQWLQDGLSGLELHVLRNLALFRVESVAQSIVSMAFLDTVEPSDVTTLDHLTRLRLTAPGLLSAISQIPWVGDGLDDLETGAIDWIRQVSDADVAASIAALGWVHDGLQGPELRAIEEFFHFKYGDSGILATVVAMGWVGDGIKEMEATALDLLNGFGDQGLASLIVAQQWLENGIESHELATLRELDLMAKQDSAATATVVGLGWVADGLNGEEAVAIVGLRRVAQQNLSLFAAIVGMDWVADGLKETEMAAARLLFGLADENLISTLTEQGWIEDGIELHEVEALRDLSLIVKRDSEVAAAVVELGWVADGIDSGDTTSLQHLRNVAVADPMAASSIVAFAWVQDSIDGLELKVLGEFPFFGAVGPDILASVVAMPWVQDDVTPAEAEAVDLLNGLPDAGFASLLLAQQWLEDGIEQHEVDVLKALSRIAYSDLAAAMGLVGLDWVADGIDAADAEALRSLGFLAQQDLTLLRTMLALKWVADGIDITETSAISTLTAMAGKSQALAGSIVELDWLRDGLTANEARALLELTSLVNSSPVRARQILQMPFLKTLGPSDVAALRSLALMSAFDQHLLSRVLSHSTLKDGITDSWTDVVATLNGAADVNPELIDELLDPDQVSVEERVIDLPLAGKTHLVIVRHTPGAGRSMDLLEGAVRRLEELMSVPFPDEYVRWLFVDDPEQVLGLYHGTHVSSIAESDLEYGSFEEAELGSLAGHELAHYYWHGDSAWIGEGVANVLRVLSDNIRNGSPIEPVNPPCPYVRTLSELEGYTATEGENIFNCNYSLGERFFLDLYRSLGQEAFEQGLRDLYLMSPTRQEYATDQRNSLGIEQIRTAFRRYQQPGTSMVDAIVARWYEGTEPYDASVSDTTPPNPDFLTINGRVVAQRLALTRGGAPVTSISADAVDDRLWLMLSWEHSVSSVTEVPLEIAIYYEDGFEFGRNHLILTANPGDSHGPSTWWFQAGPSPHEPWAEGRYQIRIYDEGRKLVELEYEVTP